MAIVPEVNSLRPISSSWDVHGFIPSNYVCVIHILFVVPVILFSEWKQYKRTFWMLCHADTVRSKCHIKYPRNVKLELNRKFLKLEISNTKKVNVQYVKYSVFKNLDYF